MPLVKSPLGYRSAVVSSSTLAYNIVGLTAGSIYAVRVSASNARGYGATLGSLTVDTTTCITCNVREVDTSASDLETILENMRNVGDVAVSHTLIALVLLYPMLA